MFHKAKQVQLAVVRTFRSKGKNSRWMGGWVILSNNPGIRHPGYVMILIFS